MELTRTLIWAGVGVALLSAEVVSSTFVLLFFGLAAFVVVAARLLGLDVLWLELIVFAAAGGAAVLLFRNKLRETMAARGSYRGDRQETLVLSKPLASGAEGHVEYQGTTWTAINESGRTLDTGERVVIVRTEGVKLFLTSKAAAPAKEG